MLRFIIKHLVGSNANNFLRYDSLLSNIPRDPRTIFTHFDLRPRTQTFVCCPACFALFPHDNSAPAQCTNYVNPEEICGAELVTTRRIRGRVFKRPIRLYVAQSLKQWVGRMLSRPDIEQHLEVPPLRDPQPDDLHDFWDGDAIRFFLGPDKRPFLEARKGELRLVFSISMDGFSPFGNSNQAVSVSAIYLVCLNLPIEIRYDSENVFLAGIIPGPHKPSLDAINHALKVIVSELQEFWDPGVYFCRTALYDEGRLAKGAIIPLVADILAARQMSGISAVTATLFCSVCYLHANEIENFDIETWPPRDPVAHHDFAVKWRDALTSEAREKITQEHGLRWSALMELPYWNPILYTAIDSMHAHWINSLKNHLEDVWRINPKAECTDGQLVDESKRPKRPSNSALRNGLETLKKSELDEGRVELVASLKKGVLFHLCYDHDIRRAGTKAMIAANLINWVSHSYI